MTHHNQRLLSSFLGGWNWSGFRVEHPLDKISFFVRKLFRQVNRDKTQEVADALGVSPPVETVPNAKKFKTLLNEGGQVYEGGYLYNTYIEPNQPALVEVEIPEEEFVEPLEPVDSDVPSSSGNVRILEKNI